ncbi:replication-associated protein [Yerba mate-associated circular DNA virus 1]|uniref:Replication-associated protein n=1 Tax=Yerba mate-associated circular DNA virus 1 TaxID=2219873 RepID=A0A2Z4ELG4_9VIRU|nr:replication-associated protein [Yerba mate-associated circular DNA virus 1]AWV57063.1 replication-associated protein [Yerba mate-associated circular DNA virus 1]
MPRATSFVFTINNPTFNPKDLYIIPLSPYIKYSIWQLENAPSTNTPHIQGYVEFTKRLRHNEFIKLTAATSIHCETRRGTPQQAQAYCSKSSTRLDGPWQTGEIPPPRIRKNNTGTRNDIHTLRDAVLMGQTDEQLLDSAPWGLARYYPFIQRIREIDRERRAAAQPFPHDLHIWQRDLIDELHGAVTDRKIIWFDDPIGGAGKSSFARHCAFNGAFYSRGGKTADVAYSFRQHISSHPETTISIFDFSRSGKEFVNYDIIEQIKDGLVVSSKYDSRTVIHVQQHLVVFANWPPDTTKLSADRWDIRPLSTEPIPDYVV